MRCCRGSSRAVLLVGGGFWFRVEARAFHRVWERPDDRSRTRSGRWHDRRSRSASRDVNKAFGQTEDHPRRQSRRREGRTPRHHRPERRRQDHAVQPDQRPLSDVVGRNPVSTASASTACRRTRSTAWGCRAASRSPRSIRTLSVFENLRCALLWSMGYRYSFWTPLWRQRELNERTDKILEELNLTPRRDTAGGSAVLRRPARARDRHDHCRRRLGDPARRTDRGHEQHRDRQRRRTDPPRLNRQDAGDGRARHEGGVRPCRRHHGAGLRPGDRLRTAAGGARQRGGAGSLSGRAGAA